MSELSQAKTIENIFRSVNTITQELLELQEEVVQLKIVQGNGKLTPEKTVEAVPIIPAKKLTPSVLDDFTGFTTDLITAKIEDNLIEISYIKSGQNTTLNKEEIYDIFVNLPDTFDRLTVKHCIDDLRIDTKNETLLMRFFVHQFKDYCERTSKGAKDRLIIRKL